MARTYYFKYHYSPFNKCEVKSVLVYMLPRMQVVTCLAIANKGIGKKNETTIWRYDNPHTL